MCYNYWFLGKCKGHLINTLSRITVYNESPHLKLSPINAFLVDIHKQNQQTWPFINHRNRNVTCW